jgi:acetyltransferase-like isoleucine patch superfamily enzyme
MQKVVIFGITNKAQELKKYLENDVRVDVCAFVVDHEYKTCEKLLDIPVVEFEHIVEVYPPNEYQIALIIGYSNMNRNRSKKYEESKSLGYSMFTYISTDANIYTDNIGEGTIILPGCNIAPFVSLGKCNIIDSCVFIGHNTVVGDFNFFAARTTVTGEVTISDNCFFGAGSTICSRVVNGYTLIAAGTTLVNDTEAGQVYHPPKAVLSPGCSDYFTIR